MKILPLELSSGDKVLLLDVDGVINAFQCSHARPTRPAPQLPEMRLLPGIDQSLTHLFAHYYVVWCSHWGPAINRFTGTAWGLEPRPFLWPLPGEAGSQDWKLKAVHRALHQWPGPIAWVEDGFRPDVMQWEEARNERGQATKLVNVYDTGLTKTVTEELLQWQPGR